MTRDEAIKKICEIPTYEGEYIIDVLAALGMLKLAEADIDEGSGQIFKIRKFMRNFHLQNFTPSQLESALQAAGLKIVEK